MSLRKIAELMANELLKRGDGPIGKCERLQCMISTGHLQEVENGGMGRHCLENTLMDILTNVMEKTDCQILHVITKGR